MVNPLLLPTRTQMLVLVRMDSRDRHHSLNPNPNPNLNNHTQMGERQRRYLPLPTPLRLLPTKYPLGPHLLVILNLLLSNSNNSYSSRCRTFISKSNNSSNNNSNINAYSTSDIIPPIPLLHYLFPQARNSRSRV